MVSAEVHYSRQAINEEQHGRCVGYSLKRLNLLEISWNNK